MMLLRSLLRPEPPRPSRRQRLNRHAVPAIRRRSAPVARPVRLLGPNDPSIGRWTAKWARLLPDLLLILLVLVISLGQNLAAVEETPFHPDESRWLNRAYYLRDLTDPFGPTWQDYVTTIGQPPLGSYVMGIGLALQDRPLDGTGVWDFAYGSEWNQEAGAMPSPEDLEAGRRTNAVVGALVVAAVYVLGRLLTNRAGGLLGGLFLAFPPLHITLSSQALSDETFVLVLALAFLAAWLFAKRPTRSRAILLGVLLGLGGAAKLSPLLLSLPLAAFGLLRLLVERDRSARRYGVMLLAQPIIAFATFVAVYPYLWPSPIRRTWALFEFRAIEMQGQAEAWPNVKVTSPLNAIARFGARLTEMDSTSKRLLQPIYDAVGIDRIATGLDYIPAVAGLLLLIWWVMTRGFWTPTALVALLTGAEVGAMVVGMGTDFYRYHLPIVVILAIWIGVSTGVLWERLMPHSRGWQWARATSAVAARTPERPPMLSKPAVPSSSRQESQP